MSSRHRAAHIPLRLLAVVLILATQGCSWIIYFVVVNYATEPIVVRYGVDASLWPERPQFACQLAPPLLQTPDVFRANRLKFREIAAGGIGGGLRGAARSGSSLIFKPRSPVCVVYLRRVSSHPYYTFTRDAVKTTVDRPGKLHFLGFRLTRNQEGRVEVHLSARTVQRLNRRLRELTPRSWGQSLAACFEQASRYLRGWLGHFRICTEQGARSLRKFDAHIRRRLRMIIVRQKGRRARYLFRHLRARGVAEGAAGRAAFCRCGPWNRSNRPGLTRAYPNAWFNERLVSLWIEWHRFNPPERVSGRQLQLFGDEVPT